MKFSALLEKNLTVVERETLMKFLMPSSLFIKTLLSGKDRDINYSIDIEMLPVRCFNRLLIDTWWKQKASLKAKVKDGKHDTIPRVIQSKLMYSSSPFIHRKVAQKPSVESFKLMNVDTQEYFIYMFIRSLQVNSF